MQQQLDCAYEPPLATSSNILTGSEAGRRLAVETQMSVPGNAPRLFRVFSGGEEYVKKDT